MGAADLGRAAPSPLCRERGVSCAVRLRLPKLKPRGEQRRLGLSTSSTLKHDPLTPHPSARRGVRQHEGCTEIQGNPWDPITARLPGGPGVFGLMTTQHCLQLEGPTPVGKAHRDICTLGTHPQENVRGYQRRGPH